MNEFDRDHLKTSSFQETLVSRAEDRNTLLDQEKQQPFAHPNTRAPRALLGSSPRNDLTIVVMQTKIMIKVDTSSCTTKKAIDPCRFNNKEENEYK
jgi:hypothetical protein